MPDPIDILKQKSQSEIADITDELKYIREDLSEGLEKIATAESQKKFFDPDLSSMLKDIIAKAIEQLTRLSIPAPIVTIDMKPFEKMANLIISQNETILKLIPESSTEKSDEKHKEVMNSLVEMINNSNKFFSNAIDKTDYTDALNRLVESNRRPVIEKFKIVKDERGIKEVIPIYKQ